MSSSRKKNPKLHLIYPAVILDKNLLIKNARTYKLRFNQLVETDFLHYHSRKRVHVVRVP